MNANGLVTVSAKRLSQAVEQVEDLGCLVLQAKTEADGMHLLRVRMSLGAANAVAHAVIRKELRFQAA